MNTEALSFVSRPSDVVLQLSQRKQNGAYQEHSVEVFSRLHDGRKNKKCAEELVETSHGVPLHSVQHILLSGEYETQNGRPNALAK